MKIKEITKNSKAIHMPDGGVYTVAMNHRTDDSFASQMFQAHRSWEADPAIVMGKKIVPYGHNNDLPTVIRRVMDNSNIGPGILERKIGLQYGEGPFLYKEEILSDEDGKMSIVRKPVQKPLIMQWLNSWDYLSYIDVVMSEFMYTKGFYTRWYRNRAKRLSADQLDALQASEIDTSNKIVKLEAVLGGWARLGWPEASEKNLANVKSIFVGDFENNCMHSGLSEYPVFDKRNPFKNGVSISYHNLYSFGRSFYSVPAYYGTLKWLMTASEIPDIINYLTENGINAAFHIHSTDEYWKNILSKLQAKYPDKDDEFIDKKLEETKEDLLQQITMVLTGKENAGKFIHTIDTYDMDGNLCSWKVESIDQKIKDFIEAQVKISDKADSAATAGMGLNPALANIVAGGALAAGSQLLYAMKFHILSDVNIPERIIFEAINQAISINFPDDSDVKMGFYRKVVMKEDEVSPSKRVSNQV